jgi:hypothetical protein
MLLRKVKVRTLGRYVRTWMQKTLSKPARNRVFYYSLLESEQGEVVSPWLP